MLYTQFLLTQPCSQLLKERYSSWDSGLGAKVEAGQADFEGILPHLCFVNQSTDLFAELEKYVVEHGEPKHTSGKQEKFEVLLNHYV